MSLIFKLFAVIILQLLKKVLYLYKINLGFFLWLKNFT